MNITNQNLSPTIAYLESLIFNNRDSNQDLAFIAIDLEMTGLKIPSEVHRPPWQYTELLPQQYARMRQVVKKFGIMQIGVSLFFDKSESKEKQDEGMPDTKRRKMNKSPKATSTAANAVSTLESDNKVKQHHFNALTLTFFTLQRSIQGIQHPLTTICPDTMQFHTSCNFDFKTWLEQGINLCTEKVEDSFQDMIRQKIARETIGRGDGPNGQNNDDVNKVSFNRFGSERERMIQLTRPEDIKFMDEIMEKIKGFMEDQDNKMETRDEDCGVKEEEEKFKLQGRVELLVNKDRMILPQMNPFLAKAMRQRVEQLYGNGSKSSAIAYIESFRPTEGEEEVDKEAGQGTKKTLPTRYLYRSLTKDDIHQLENAQQEQQLLKTKQWISEYRVKALGFRRVWQLLKSSQKPLIFHNGFYDLLFLYHYLEADLPETYQEFKMDFTRRMRGSTVLDTKIPCHTVLAVKYSEKIPISSLEHCSKFVMDEWENQKEGGSPGEQSLKITDLDAESIVWRWAQGQQGKSESLSSEQKSKSSEYPNSNDFLSDPNYKLWNEQMKTKQLEKLKKIEDGEKIVKEEKYHDAGYDAYMTGRVFLGVTRMEKLLLQPNTIPASSSQFRVKLDGKDFPSDGDHLIFRILGVDAYWRLRERAEKNGTNQTDPSSQTQSYSTSDVLIKNFRDQSQDFSALIQEVFKKESTNTNEKAVSSSLGTTTPVTQVTEKKNNLFTVWSRWLDTTTALLTFRINTDLLTHYCFDETTKLQIQSDEYKQELKLKKLELESTVIDKKLKSLGIDFVTVEEYCASEDTQGGGMNSKISARLGRETEKWKNDYNSTNGNGHASTGKQNDNTVAGNNTTNNGMANGTTTTVKKNRSASSGPDNHNHTAEIESPKNQILTLKKDLTEKRDEFHLKVKKNQHTLKGKREGKKGDKEKYGA